MNDYTKIEDLLEDLYQIIEETKSGGIFGGGKGIDKESAFNILEDIRYHLPREIKEAQKIIDNADKILKDAKHEATKIIRIGEEEVERMVKDHSITKLVKQDEEIRREEVNNFVVGMREGAIRYADQCLGEVEMILQEAINEIGRVTKDTEDKLGNELNRVYQNRQEIKKEELYKQ